MKNVFLLLASLLLGSAMAGGCRQSPPPHTQPQPFQGFDRPSVQHHPQPPGGGTIQSGTPGTAPQQTPRLQQQAPRTRQQVPPTHQQAPPTHQQAPPTHQQAPPTHQQAPLPQQPQGGDSFQSPETPLVD